MLFLSLFLPLIFQVKCQSSWFEHSDKLYSFNKTLDTYANHSKNCRDQWMEIAIIRSNDEIEFVSKRLIQLGIDSVWIGVSCFDGKFKWNSLDAISVAGWHSCNNCSSYRHVVLTKDSKFSKQSGDHAHSMLCTEPKDRYNHRLSSQTVKLSKLDTDISSAINASESLLEKVAHNEEILNLALQIMVKSINISRTLIQKIYNIEDATNKTLEMSNRFVEHSDDFKNERTYDIYDIPDKMKSILIIVSVVLLLLVISLLMSTYTLYKLKQ